ncbi:serine/threonine-protein kinase [Cerasibacillus quisquiliarum]|uniref:non-specific serine/threonine protein kinase n=1 Tax=Cerasibacillus quisquiliarum TaxID=227865 RepID=A0A511UVZ8_9BACI|nr:serine/threonine-protein kinase [Cerasibacillus quisquiliarum]MBB5145037.1 serine/threonine-protein kinase [Cerasibacillus quisquiliarum]GEN30071.1 serine/threonine protein kinase [Cerasibacillus quisquiliarum]
MLKIGDIVDKRYEVLKEIGRGGMSVVYLAMDNRLNKSLVIKDIRKRDKFRNEILVNSLVVEANLLKKLDHHALPRIYDIIESSGDIYVVMDYIEGESLKEKMAREGIQDADDVIDWAKQLADVLHYLHTRQPNPIIYRDMKPDNIMLTPDGHIKLIDFGIAREYKEEQSTDTTNLGTKAYAAPEQISGKQTDVRTDIYSLGMTLYHLVTGKTLNDPPFEVKPIRYWNPTLPEGLEYIISVCTQAEPENRYQSCRDLLIDLENIDKLTEGYKKLLYKRMLQFIIPSVFLILFTTSTVLGYNGMKKELFQDYTRLINQANQEVVADKEAKAIELLQEAIDLDHKRSEAYINLLNIFINTERVEEGLDMIETYIKDKYGNTHKNQDVLYKVGMTYFDYQNDYQQALHYFKQIDEEDVPAVKYYKTLATAMSQLEINFDDFLKELASFEIFNDSLPNDVKKIENYHALVNIYISYKAHLEEANTKAIEIIEKATKTLSLIDDDSLRAWYELSFERKLAQSYYSRGFDQLYQTDGAVIDREASNSDFSLAIEHYQALLHQVNEEEKEDIMVTIGVILQEMGKTAEAEAQFKKTIHTYPENIQAYVKLGNMLLDLEVEKNKPNLTKVKQVMKEAEKIENIEKDEGFKKLQTRFNQLSER